MPYVNVRVTAGVTREEKLEVIKGITDVLVNVLGKNPDSTFVVIDEVETDNWGHKGTSVTELRKAGRAGSSPKPPPAKKTPAAKPRKTSAKA